MGKKKVEEAEGQKPVLDVEEIDKLLEEKPKTKEEIEKDRKAKLKKLDKIVGKLSGKYGSDFARRQAMQKIDPAKNVITTGVFAVDWALGVGGIFRGRLYEVFGDPGSGKTCFTFNVIGEYQKAGKVVAFIDAEHAFDAIFAQRFGVNIEQLWILEPDTLEEAFDSIYQMVEQEAVDLIVVDSVPAMVPKLIMEGQEKELNWIGYPAIQMNRHVEKLNAKMGKSKTSVIFINQTYEKIGDIYAKFKEPETKRGKGLKFYASVRIEVKKKKTLKNNDKDAIGNTSLFYIRKNKLAIPYRKADNIYLNYMRGYDKELDMINMALKFKLVQKKAGWLLYGEEKIHGIKDMRDMLKENLKFRNEIHKKLTQKVIESIIMSEDETEICQDDINLEG